MARPAGFRFVQRDNGTVIITHDGRHASTLRGRRAAAFLGEVAGGDPQLVMARWTGNYKRGMSGRRRSIHATRGAAGTGSEEKECGVAPGAGRLPR